jgi:hypothetical protein
LVAAGTTYVLGLGWATTLATSVVPCIADLTFVTTSPTAEAMAERYPDLAKVEPDQRGGVMMSKIISDQVSGGATGVWFGVGLALLTAGLTGVGGAVVAGYLRRRGDALRPAVWTYLGLTLPSVVTVALCVSWAICPITEPLTGSPFRAPIWLAGGLIGFAILNGAGAVRRQPPLLRAASILGWFVILVQILRPDTPWAMTLGAVALAGGLHVARAFLPVPSGGPVPATA